MQTHPEITAELKNNPFMHASPLPHQAPEWDKITTDHFRPAFEYGFKAQLAEIADIVNNKEAPTFENTLIALERSGRVLYRAKTAFYHYSQSLVSAETQALEKEFAPKFAAHIDSIYLNDGLYQRIKTVSQNMSALDEESKRLVTVYLQRFEMLGAMLNDAQKEQLRTINGELAGLYTEFVARVLKGRKINGLLVKDAKELDGLTADQIAQAAAEAKNAGHDGQYLLTLSNTTQQPLLAVLHNRKIREQLFKASLYRNAQDGAADNRAIIERLALLHMKKAQLLGKKSFAEWRLQDQMAQTPENAIKLLTDLAKASIAKVKEEAAEIQKLIDSQKGGFKLEPWDWYYYAEQVRKAKYDLDESEVKPYFELHNVLEKGVLYAAERFYGITAKKRDDIPVYHPEAIVYEIFDLDGSALGLIYFDFYARESKGGGAWMNNFVDQSKLLQQNPVIVNVFNFTKPAAGKPTLLNFYETKTLFHEFGHALHGLFADQQYATLSGANVARDFVEFPSQFNENFALAADIFKNYAVHYQTQEPMPEALMKKIVDASLFNNGYTVSELLFASILDMAWHSATDESQFKPTLEFEKAVLEKYGMSLPEVPARYLSTYFMHIWRADGPDSYTAGYYAYTWADLLTADGWDWVVNHGGVQRKNGDHYRKTILSRGNTLDYNAMYQNFADRKPSLTPLLKAKGL
ncbi:M3 family metallopeptidase [Dichelobacter nodosus]|uniref:Dipeptidyl carboxypeptidase n=1 Tax=Dichelobacter nodosus (strain VCS1703A) TaxID=246195 RepID=A5EX14_DICNV|nr:M3 family metallopeptidase [Dichelobacter nodosus]ABQ14089.1 peptidyl-dipeptidase II [Dichelobacter nodosus VCS1703A]